MRTLAIVLGLAFAVIAIVYWLVPAGSLPSVFPGFEAGSTRVHVKHVSPRPPSPSCFSPSHGTPGDPAPEARREPASLRLPRDDDALELVEDERNQKADDRDHE